MHSLNGLEVDAWANERYQRMITDAQRDLRAQAIARECPGNRFGWLRKLFLGDWRCRPGARVLQDFQEKTEHAEKKRLHRARREN